MNTHFSLKHDQDQDKVQSIYTQSGKCKIPLHTAEELVIISLSTNQDAFLREFEDSLAHCAVQLTAAIDIL